MSEEWIFKASRDLLLDLTHSQVALGAIVGKTRLQGFWGARRQDMRAAAEQLFAWVKVFLFSRKRGLT